MKEQFMILLHHAKIQKRFFDAFYSNWKVTETPGMVKDAKNSNVWHLRNMGRNWTEINRNSDGMFKGCAGFEG